MDAKLVTIKSYRMCLMSPKDQSRVNNSTEQLNYMNRTSSKLMSFIKHWEHCF